MRISDWSSDVCSSDLENISCTFSGIRDHGRPGIGETHTGMAGNAEAKPAAQRGADWLHTALLDRIVPYAGAAELSAYRSIDEHGRSEEHTSELQSLMRIQYAVFCLKKKTKQKKLRSVENVPRNMTLKIINHISKHKHIYHKKYSHI